MAYIDNIIIYASNKDLYKLRLSRFFNACQQENLKLKLNKCHHFLIAKFILFGFQLDLQTHTITPEPCKVETILKIQPPTNKKQLKSFIGALSFLAPLIPNLQADLAPLHSISGPKAKFIWSFECQDSFDKVKKIWPLFQFCI